MYKARPQVLVVFTIACVLVQSVSVCGDWVYNAEQTLPIPSRYAPACANNAWFNQSTVTSALLGGYNNNIYYNDTWTGPSTFSSPTPTFVQSGYLGVPAQVRWAAYAAYTNATSLVWLSGFEFADTLNSVYTSADNGATWIVANNGAPWVARQYPAITLMPTDNRTLVLIAGSVADGWISTNGGTSWSQLSSALPMGALQGAALVGLRDASLVLSGGSNGSAIVNTVWLSSTASAGVWSVLPTPPFSPRYHHSMTADSTSLIFLYGGCTTLTANYFPNVGCPSDGFLYVSATRGYSWQLIQQTAAASGTVAPIAAQSFACLTVIALSNGSRSLIIYGGVDANATVRGVFTGILNLTATYNGTIPALSSTGATITTMSSSSSSYSAAAVSSASSVAVSSASSTAAVSVSSTSGRSSSSSSTGVNGVSRSFYVDAVSAVVCALAVAVMTSAAI